MTALQDSYAADFPDYGERMLRGIGPRRVFQLLAVPEDSLHGVARAGFRDKMAA